MLTARRHTIPLPQAPDVRPPTGPSPTCPHGNPIKRTASGTGFMVGQAFTTKQLERARPFHDLRGRGGTEHPERPPGHALKARQIAHEFRISLPRTRAHDFPG